MTVFSVALLSEHPDSISFAGALRNLAFVSVGNAVAGGWYYGRGLFGSRLVVRSLAIERHPRRRGRDARPAFTAGG